MENSHWEGNTLNGLQTLSHTHFLASALSTDDQPFYKPCKGPVISLPPSVVTFFDLKLFKIWFPLPGILFQPYFAQMTKITPQNSFSIASPLITVTDTGDALLSSD